MRQTTTVQNLSKLFHRDAQTIRRWIDEGREIVFDGWRYVPEKDPAGNWLFVMHLVEAATSEQVVVSVRRRRVLSSGIK